MKYLSVCSGIEAASVAWKPLGWQPVAFSEIEAFPCTVLAHHYPNTPNWGDMTCYEQWPDAKQTTVDLLCGGTPCQSFSLAGLRKGLADPRGSLMLTFGAIAGRYRPRWLVWENVHGVLSSHGGRDFGTFLGMLAQLGYGFAYRVLDAQCVRVSSHPGAVPQRRRRVFVVGHSGGCWQRAAAVLFERESLRGHPAPCGQTRKTVASLTACGIGTCGADDNQGQAGHLVAAPEIPDIVGQAMCSKWAKGTSGPAGDEHHNLLPVRPQGESSYRGVRRLTPLECERLMGFPDGYTDVPHKGKPAADSARYQALGNSWAVNCARWIGERIRHVDSIT